MFKIIVFSFASNAGTNPTLARWESKSADPSACGVLNSIRFDSKSEVKRSESEAKRKAKRSESEVKRSESESEAKSEASRSEAID